MNKKYFMKYYKVYLKYLRINLWWYILYRFRQLNNGNGIRQIRNLMVMKWKVME